MSRKDNRKTLTEDIFGFRVMWTYAERWCSCQGYRRVTRENLDQAITEPGEYLADVTGGEPKQ